MLKLGFVPLEVMLRLPLAAPLVVGEKSAVNEVLWPAFNVNGKVSPLKLNPVPLAVAAEIMRLDPPELVRVSDKVVPLPACTLPNARLVGVAASAPCVTPVPESARFKVGFAPSEVILTLPGAAPPAFGEESNDDDA